MEHKVGEVITLEVVESNGHDCYNCFFYKLTSNFCDDVYCTSKDREDNKNIIYREISRSESTTCC